MEEKRIRKCPVCGKPMKEKTIEGVVIDKCSEHGIWLDKGEQKKILEKVKKRLE